MSRHGLNKPKVFFGLFGGNEILDGLEAAARLGFENLKNPGQAINPGDLDGKTRAIRTTLIAAVLGAAFHTHQVVARLLVAVSCHGIAVLGVRLHVAVGFYVDLRAAIAEVRRLLIPSG